jgi:C1A family cysteine protease
VGVLPSHVDLRPQCPDVYDQGQIGSCTANALAGDIEFVKMKQGNDKTGTPARLDIYEQERKKEHTFPQDSGASVRDGVKCGEKVGFAPESDWPYSQDNLNIDPTSQVLADRSDNKIGEAINVDHTDINQLKQSLADGFPVTLGIKVFQSFESDDNVHTGVINMPQANDKVLGGHAMLLVGYDDDSQRFIFRNSWKLKDGTPWGDKGYGTIPYDYITSNKLAYPNEFWSVRSVSTAS